MSDAAVVVKVVGLVVELVVERRVRFVVRDVVVVVGVALGDVEAVVVVVVVGARTTRVVVASRLPFGAVCLAVTVYRPAATDARKRRATLPSLLAAPAATVAPSSTIDTVEHRCGGQKPSPNAVATSPLATGFGATRSRAFALGLSAAYTPVVGTRHNANTCTTAMANGRLARFIASRPYSNATVAPRGDDLRPRCAREGSVNQSAAARSGKRALSPEPCGDPLAARGLAGRSQCGCQVPRWAHCRPHG